MSFRCPSLRAARASKASCLGKGCPFWEPGYWETEPIKGLCREAEWAVAMGQTEQRTVRQVYMGKDVGKEGGAGRRGSQSDQVWGRGLML